MQVFAITSFAHRPPVTTGVQTQIENIKEMGVCGADSEKLKIECHHLLQKTDAKNESTVVALLEVAIELQSKGKLDAAEVIYFRIDQANGNSEAHQRYENIQSIRRGFQDSFKAIMPMLQKTADQQDRPMASFFCAQALMANENRTHQDVESAVGYFEKALREGHLSAKDDLINAQEELNSMKVLARVNPDNAAQPTQNLVMDQQTLIFSAAYLKKAAYDALVPDFMKKK